MELQVEDQIILSSIKTHPNPAELEQLNSLILQVRDWDYLIHTIIDRGIAPLFYTKLSLLPNSSVIPETVKTKLQQAYYKTISRSALLYEHFRKIAEAFVAQNIPLIGLKGIYLSEWLYKDIGLRQFSDIDLLVKEEDALSCLAILSEMGYGISEYQDLLSEFVLLQIKNENDIVHFPPMIKDGVSIEIHIKLHTVNEKYHVIVSELWKNAIPVTINGITVFALNNSDLLIHLCLHLDKHFKSGHVQFTCFNDITNLLEKYGDTLNWNEFIESCKLYNCEEVVYKYLVMVNKYMNASVPKGILEKYSYLLKQKDMQLFSKYLKGNDIKIFKSYFTTHLKSLKSIDSISEKILYLKDILFPSKAFMIQAYSIKRPGLVLFYYPYRYWIGVRGVLRSL